MKLKKYISILEELDLEESKEILINDPVDNDFDLLIKRVYYKEDNYLKLFIKRIESGKVHINTIGIFNKSMIVVLINILRKYDKCKSGIVHTLRSVTSEITLTCREDGIDPFGYEIARSDTPDNYIILGEPEITRLIAILNSFLDTGKLNDVDL